MKHRVTLTRTRTVEEKVVVVITAPKPDDALDVVLFRIGNKTLTWKYNKTINTSDAEVDIQEEIEIKSKR